MRPHVSRSEYFAGGSAFLVLVGLAAVSCSSGSPAASDGEHDLHDSGASADRNEPDARDTGALRDTGSVGDVGDAGSPKEGGGETGSGEGGASVETLLFENFDAPGLSLPLTGWSMGSQAGGTLAISTDATQNYAGSAGSLIGTYPVSSGGVYVWAGYDISALSLEDIYIDFWASMPLAKQGMKFLKIFGGNTGGDTSNYANTTFGLDYTGVDFGCMYQVSFGDGTGIANDTADVINFDGTNPDAIGRSYGTATVSTPQMSRWASSSWGTGWHHFQMHVRFDTGTTAADEVADGAYFVAIDGVTYVDAHGLFNRNYTNAPIASVALFNWSQNGSTPFTVLYDDVRITTGGFVP